MEMPITKPSMVSYADELDFHKLVEDLAKESKNGFIRVTSGSEEGYILFKAGKQVAASYENYSKLEALEKINSSSEAPNTVIEVFDIGPAQVDYLLDLNKPYKIEEGTNVYDVIGELKKTPTETPEEPQPEVAEPEIEEPVVKESESVETEVNEPETAEPEVKESEVAEPEIKESEVAEPEAAEPVVKESEAVEPEIKESDVAESEVAEPEVKESEGASETTTNKAEDASDEKEVVDESDDTEAVKTHSTVKKPVKQSESLEASLKDEEPESGEYTTSSESIESSLKDEELEAEEDPESSESVEAEEAPIDRSELLKKYGIKDVEEEQVEDLLQTYKGGIIDDDDVEKVELVLMNLIKKSVLGIPKIKGTEVMVFLDNYKELTGTINIITEYETQGFFNRIMGQSRTASNLRRQIINIAEIAIRKSFRQYPEVVDKFEINVEFS
ncbi:DUF2226 domain-containing protein [Methanobacterium petrolearium]|uniref:DUF2226 domain-containing protein n=1 Tax=Methanobacterium petrolearium TaxID=710190 RepID=UPI001AE61DBD|nr:DUF2226 domain-containing protein [Methanobacterium petrolearium]MBP1945679.1 chemotaxis protein histidine kinase CheA [Methanobacterium petrolearium]BDZ71920.1 hypothetical protein GCM10025861_24370 [Methanobacterium petrolearium]